MLSRAIFCKHRRNLAILSHGRLTGSTEAPVYRTYIRPTSSHFQINGKNDRSIAIVIVAVIKIVNDIVKVIVISNYKFLSAT